MIQACRTVQRDGEKWNGWIGDYAMEAMQNFVIVF